MVVSNDEREGIRYKLLTTKSKSKHDSWHVREELNNEFVLMNRIEDNLPPMGPRYAHLDFTGIRNFKWKHYTYISVRGHYLYPRNAPRKYLGSLTSWREFEELYRILQVGDNRVNGGVLRALFRFSGISPGNFLMSSTQSIY